MEQTPIGAPARESLLLRAGLLRPAVHSARPWIEASGTTRTADGVEALRGEGIEAYRFDGAGPDPGLERALGKAEAIVVSIPPARGARGGARSVWGRDRRGAGAAGASSIIRPSGSTATTAGAWVDETSATRTRTARGLARLEDEARWAAAARARGAETDILRLAGIYGPGRNALTICAGARRGGSSSRAGVQPRPCR